MREVYHKRRGALQESRSIPEQRGILCPEELHKLARKTKQAVGATLGDKATCHSDYVDDETAKTLQAVELVESERL